MLDDLLTKVVIAVVFATVVFTCAAGGRTERIGAGIFAANTAINFLILPLLPLEGPVPMLVCDSAAALAFGALALSAPEKLWPGVAGVGQTLVVTFSATRILEFPLGEFAYVAALNLSGICVELALIIGACLHRWGRRTAADAQPGFA